MNLKPLIFIYPLSETMKKLKEEVEKMPKSEGVEVYEVDQLSEVAQLIPSVGQSLSIYGTPKKCAMALKQLRKVNAKLNSKVLLLSDKSIPRKTLDKFSKIGLTEFIQEPVAPKTLLYKVKLQLKSIVASDDSDEDDIGVKSSKEDHEEEDLSYGQVKRNTKEQEDGLDYLTKKQKKNDLIIEEEEENKKKSFHEEDIESHWQGKIEKNTSTKDNNDEDETHTPPDNSLDGYLRGKKKKSVEYQEEEKKRNTYTDIIEDKNLQGEVQESEEEEYSIEKMKRSFESFTEEELNNMRRSQSLEPTHYKGEVSNSEEELESIDKKRSTLEIIDNDETEEVDNEEEELYTHKKNKKKFELIEDTEEKSHRKTTPEEELEDIDNKSSLEIEDETPTSKGSTDHIENKENSGKNSTDQIDAYLRGGAAQRSKEQDDKENNDREKEFHSQKKEEQEHSSKDAPNQHEEERKKDHQLDIDLAGNTEDKEENKSTEESDSKIKKKNQGQEEESQDKSKNNNESEDLGGHLKTSKCTEKEENDKQDRKKDKHTEELEKKNKKHDSTVDDLTQEQLKANSKVDNIQTHYSSEASVSHIDDNWDFTHEETTKEEKDKDKKTEMNMVYNEKIDLGEQTIDYRKLKDEFSGFTMDREGNNVKNTGPKYYGGGKNKKEVYPRYYSENEDGQRCDAEESEVTDEEHQNIIFEPKSQGLENIVRILNYYYLESNAEEESYKFISDIIQKNFKGHVAIYYYDEKKSRVKESINSLSLLDQPIENDLQKAWDKLFSNNYRSWKEIKLPTWTDITFQEKEIQFVYPFFEGATLMGFAVAWFIDGFNEKKCKELEVSLESLRGFLISHFRKEMQKGKYKGTVRGDNKSKINPIKSLLGKFFGKRAA